MSRTAIIFIEFRENSSKPWELFCPLMKKSHQEYQNGYQLGSETINGEEYTYVFNDEKQGDIRDYLDSNNYDFNMRGFPKDMSSMLDKYITNIKVKGDLEGTWGHSYVTIDEFTNVIRKDKEKLDSWFAAYSTNDQFKIIKRKLDGIMEYLKYSKLDINFDEPENDDDSDWDAAAEYQDQMNGYNWSLEYLEAIEQMVAFCTSSWEGNHEIRLVYFIC